MTLQPCVACGRHVRVEDAACPFCGAPVDEAEPRPSLRGRVSRAAVFAAASLAACGSHDAKPAEGSADNVMVSGYGAAPVPLDKRDAAVADAPAAVAIDAAPVAAPVDAPVDAAPIDAAPIDAAPRRDAGAAHPDAGPIHHIAKPYGAPPARRRIV
jgi:hypothetical protein